jgi:hypothetical protein
MYQFNKTITCYVEPISLTHSTSTLQSPLLVNQRLKPNHSTPVCSLANGRQGHFRPAPPHKPRNFKTPPPRAAPPLHSPRFDPIRTPSSAMRRDDAGDGTGFHELFDSVRRSISFRTAADAPAASPAAPFGGGGGGGIGVRINSCLRKSRGMGLLGLIPKSPSPPRRLLPQTPDESKPGGGGRRDRCGEAGRGEENPSIRWRKGELIGCGAFGQVYLGMNLDSGELLAVKQVMGFAARD